MYKCLPLLFVFAAASCTSSSSTTIAPDLAAPDLTTVIAGCQKDADCKGARICVEGNCVDPPVDMTVVDLAPLPDLAPPPDLAPVLDFVVLDLTSDQTHGPDLWQAPDLYGVDFAGTCHQASDCVLPHATGACGAGGTCIVTGCASGYVDCDKQPENGCEINLLSDTKNCGKCANVCSPVTNGSPGCTNGVCVIASCTSPYSDCDHTYSDGCEANLQTNTSNCGGCGNACSGTCSNGACH